MHYRLRAGALGGALTLLLVFTVATAALPAADSPVADAAMRGDTEAVRALLRQGADVNAAQDDGMTALHWTALRDDVETMRLLVYAGATMDPLTRLGGYTPLHLASAEGHGEAVALLLESGSDPSSITSTGVRPLHLAAEGGDPEAVAALLVHGAEVDAKDATHGRTPLIFAASRNRLEAMKVLVAAGADAFLATNVVDYVQRSQADSAAAQLRRRVADAAAGREPEGRGRGGRGAPATQAGQPGRGEPPAGRARGGRGAAPANQAVPPDPDDPPVTPRPGNAARRPDPADPDDPPGTPRAGRRAEASRNDAARNAPDRTAIRNAPRSLSNTEQIGRQGGFAAIHYAAREGFTDAALMLLEAGTDIDLLTTGDRSSPMLVAIINGNFDLAMELLERGADPNLASEDGATPLFAAINQEWHLRTWYPQPTANEQQQTSYLELMEALLEAGADPNARTKSDIWYVAYNAGRRGVDYTGATAFWRAAYAADVAAMRLLVGYGADPNVSTLQLQPSRRRSFGDPDEDEEREDPSGLPPVPPGGPHVHPLHAATGVGFGTSRVAQQHRSAPDGWMAAVRYLVEELGADVDVRDADGFTPLHNAAARGDNEMVLYLIDRGADPLAVSRRGQTTVDMANSPEQRTQPYPETIALLESFGAVNNNNCRVCN